MRPPDPGRLEFRPERHDQQHAECLESVDGPTERFQARGVGPMRILEDHQHGIVRATVPRLRDKRLQRFLPALLRRQIEARDSGHRSAATASRQKVRRPRIEVEVCASSASSLSSFILRAVFVRQSGGTLHLADDRIKRAVGVLRRAEIAQARVRLGGEAFQKAAVSRDLPMPASPESSTTCLRRSLLSTSAAAAIRFFFPPDQGSQIAGVQRLEAALDGTARSAAHARTGPAMPLRSSARVPQFEQIAEKSSRALGDDHHVRLGDPLQARRKVWRLADDAALLRLARPDQIADHDQPGRNADTGLQNKAEVASAATRAISSSPARTARSASCSCACG